MPDPYAEPYLQPIGLGPRYGDDPDWHPLAGLEGLGSSRLLAISRAGEGGRATIRLSPDEAQLSHPDLWAHLTAPRPSLCGLPIHRPLIMGIVNVTPDSFSDGSQHDSMDVAIAHARALEAEGADILDIGGESTRPGSDAVALEAERARVLPVLAGLAGRSHAVISVDTRKPQLMAEAKALGAQIWNDVSGLTFDPQSVPMAVHLGLPVIVMHAAGDPKTMQDDPRYADCPLDVYDWLAARIAVCAAAGIPRDRLIVDPGIGFGKTLEHNLALFRDLALFHGLGCRLLVGASRKRFIGTLTATPRPADRLAGSLAAALHAAHQGVHILRVHDVAETKAALRVFASARSGHPQP